MKTVKDLMNELGVSDQTIRNEAKSQNITQIKNGKFYYYGDEDAERISTAIASRNNSKRRKENTQKLQQVNDFVKFLENELKVKNDRIEKLENEKAFLMKQLEDVTASLKAEQENLKAEQEKVKAEQANVKAAQENLKAAQQLHAKSMLSIEQHNDRAWWQFWKPKRTIVNTVYQEAEQDQQGDV